MENIRERPSLLFTSISYRGKEYSTVITYKYETWCNLNGIANVYLTALLITNVKSFLERLLGTVQ
jgi:hypothetical protein